MAAKPRKLTLKVETVVPNQMWRVSVMTGKNNNKFATLNDEDAMKLMDEYKAKILAEHPSTMFTVWVFSKEGDPLVEQLQRVT